MRLQVNIHKDFGKFQLDCSFETESGQVTGLLGASGCGKSLTLKCIAGIEKPDRAALCWTIRCSSTRSVALTCPPRSGR